jgi:hypothetical protein
MTAEGSVLELLTTPVNSATHWSSLYVADDRAEVVADLTQRPLRRLARSQQIA